MKYVMTQIFIEGILALLKSVSHPIKACHETLCRNAPFPFKKRIGYRDSIRG